MKKPKDPEDECTSFLKHYPEDGVGSTYIPCTRPRFHKGKHRGLLDVRDQRGDVFQIEVFWRREA